MAADFEESLKDLQSNNRYEISNLTVIAKENTEHAQAISKALENHIKQVWTIGHYTIAYTHVTFYFWFQTDIVYCRRLQRANCQRSSCSTALLRM